MPGKRGPKAAGRAKKKVELSSVRLIIAEGGKSEEGMLKEKRACNPDVRPASVFGVATLDEESAEKKVRKIGKKMMQKMTRRKRGGRMSADE